MPEWQARALKMYQELRARLLAAAMEAWMQQQAKR